MSLSEKGAVKVEIVRLKREISRRWTGRDTLSRVVMNEEERHEGKSGFSSLNSI